MWGRFRYHASTSSRVIHACPSHRDADECPAGRAPAARWRSPMRLPEQHGGGCFDKGDPTSNARIDPFVMVYIRTIRLLIHAMQKAMVQSVCGGAKDGIGADPGPCPKGLRTAVKKLLS